MVKFIKGYPTDQEAMDYVERKKVRMQDPNYRPNPNGQLSDDSDSVGISAEEVSKEAVELSGAPPPKSTGSSAENAVDLTRDEPPMLGLGRKPDFDLDPNPPNVIFRNAPATRQDASAAGEPASEPAATASSVVGSMQRGFRHMYASPGYRRVATQEESEDSDEDEDWEDEDDW